MKIVMCEWDGVIIFDFKGKIIIGVGDIVFCDVVYVVVDGGVKNILINL